MELLGTFTRDSVAVLVKIKIKRHFTIIDLSPSLAFYFKVALFSFSYSFSQNFPITKA